MNYEQLITKVYRSVGVPDWAILDSDMEQNEDFLLHECSPLEVREYLVDYFDEDAKSVPEILKSN